METSESALRSALSAGQDGNDTRQWSWWAEEGEHFETYTVNEPTREAVIQVARDEFGADATFTIIEATQDGPFSAEIFDDRLMELIFERFGEANEERWGEDGFEGSSCSDDEEQELRDALRAALEQWLQKHVHTIPSWAFTETRNKEVIRPEPTPEPAR